MPMRASSGGPPWPLPRTARSRRPTYLSRRDSGHDYTTLRRIVHILHTNITQSEQLGPTNLRPAGRGRGVSCRGSRKAGVGNILRGLEREKRDRPRAAHAKRRGPAKLPNGRLVPMTTAAAPRGDNGLRRAGRCGGCVPRRGGAGARTHAVEPAPMAIAYDCDPSATSRWQSTSRRMPPQQIVTPAAAQIAGCIPRVIAPFVAAPSPPPPPPPPSRVEGRGGAERRTCERRANAVRSVAHASGGLARGATLKRTAGFPDYKPAA